MRITKIYKCDGAVRFTNPVAVWSVVAACLVGFLWLLSLLR
jgi:hypothetical protein